MIKTIKYMSHKSNYNPELKKYYVNFCSNEYEKGLNTLCFLVDIRKGEVNNYEIYRVETVSEEDYILKLRLYDKCDEIVDEVSITVDDMINTTKEFKCFIETERMVNRNFVEVIKENYDYVAKYDKESNMISFYKTSWN